jgi:DNA replicative helicase MCM subunit Mcm2 (Cdc46/Mcm family)
MASTYEKFPIPEALTKRGVKDIIKQGNIAEGYTMSIIIDIHNIDKYILFDIARKGDKRWIKTLQNFDIASVGHGLTDETKAMIRFHIISIAAQILGYDPKDAPKYEEPEIDQTAPKPTSVTEAMRTHSGTVILSGMIVTASKLYQLVNNARWKCTNEKCNTLVEIRVLNILEPPTKPKECEACGCNWLEDKHDLINVVSLGIQEEIQNQENSLDELEVLVFNDDTRGLQVDDCATIIGDIKTKQDSRTKQYHTMLLTKRIQYQNRKTLDLTSNDKRGIERFRKFENYKQRVIRMFAPNVIGHDDKKFALLLATIGAPEFYDKDGNRIRGRINVLSIGPSGLAKTKLGREVIRLRPNSRYVSAKNTTGGSMTCMILRENEKLVLHLGPVPLAKNAICFVNEFDKLSPENQDNLLEVMEEGRIDANKFAKLLHIDAPTTIMASANPMNNRWNDYTKISLDEIPFSATILNRFDLILPYRDTRTEEEDREYAYAKTEYDARNIKHNYNFLQKLIEHAKEINPILTTQAEGLLNEYWVKIKQQANFASNPRTLDVIHRIAKAITRFYFSPVVDENIATQTIEFMNRILGEFHCSIFIVPDPFKTSYDETMRVIRKQKVPIDVIEAVKTACDRSDQVKHYIGKIFEQSRNKKLRNLCIKIAEDESIIITKSKPLVAISKTAAYDQCDPYDPKKLSSSDETNFIYDQNDINISTNTVGRNSKIDDEICSDRSHRSQRSYSIEKHPDKQENQRINQFAYRLGRSDKFRCSYPKCKLSGDKWEILYKHFHEEKSSNDNYC